MPLEVSLDASPEVAKRLSQGIVDFNQKAVPNLEPIEAEIRFHVLASDDFGEIIGGLRAGCYWNTLHIELLWLGEQARGCGLGMQIMGQAEAFAVQNGCGKSLVETTSWQAKPFYERCGYELMATLPDRPKGYASHYMVKTLLNI